MRNSGRGLAVEGWRDKKKLLTRQMLGFVGNWQLARQVDDQKKWWEKEEGGRGRHGPNNHKLDGAKPGRTAIRVVNLHQFSRSRSTALSKLLPALPL